MFFFVIVVNVMSATLLILLVYIFVFGVDVMLATLLITIFLVHLVVVVVVMLATLSITIQFLPAGRIAGIRKSEQWPAHHHTL